MHSGIAKLWQRIQGAQVLHEEGCCLLIQPWLPLHKGLVQELDSVTPQLGLLLPVHQPAITECACDRGLRFCLPLPPLPPLWRALWTILVRPGNAMHVQSTRLGLTSHLPGSVAVEQREVVQVQRA